MAAGTRSIDPRTRTLRELAAGTACLVSVTAGLQLVAGYAPNPITRAFVGAFALSLVASTVGLDAEAPGPSVRRRILRATLLGLAAALVSLAAALALGGHVRSGEVGLGTLLGVAESLAVAYRDEVWLRGLPLYFARRAGLSSRVTLPYLVATGVCAVALDPVAKVSGLALTAANGLAFAALWLRTGDPWAPVAAHGAWRIASDVVFAGDVVELEPSKIPTSVGASGILAWVGVAAALGVALSASRALPAEGSDEPPREDDVAPEEAGESGPHDDAPSDEDA
ncbi:MAG: CPBP family intramembrane metalloprotease [Deltaproteobacteria bacterium]|nr:CPBP family intramembrane metalloprotease [Deltaproteobacteria bacterium]